MTTLQQIRLTCPACEKAFSSQLVVSTNNFGGKRTDFHERAAGTQPLPFIVHSCPECGYTASEREFTQPEMPIDFLTRETLASKLRALGFPNRNAVGSEKYEAAHACAVVLGECARTRADLLLRAAWCCVDEGDTEAERYFRRHAAWAFEEALAETRFGDADAERPTLTYLVGELWRRVGDNAKAQEWFAKVPGAVTDLTTQKWVVDVARQQAESPREWFG
jgi:uncharacterized protein (DUF2225 family)